jgi:transposase, IS5 family
LQIYMLSKPVNIFQMGFYSTFEEQLSRKHPLYILANRVNWHQFDEAFKDLYCADNGRPAKPIRLMVSLLMLKHIRDLSDESVVEQWQENSYYQYFGGATSFVAAPPCEASELVHFRKRIGEQGIELILKESIRINGDDSNDPDVSIDTTVQEKNITFPTDNKLHRKIIKKCQQIAEKEQLPVRQSYTRTLKKLGVDQRFRHHPKNKGKARKADRKVKTIAGRLVRELERNLSPGSMYQNDLNLFKKVLAQKRNDSGKIYSLHEPEVQCISKGKEHKKYEFGNKVSVVYTQNTGVIVGAKGFRNEYDGHTLEPSLQQVEKLTGTAPRTACVDRGYRGVTLIGDTRVQIPQPFNDKKQSKYQQRKLKKSFKRRAAIEPLISHLKTDHRLSRNFYKGVFGDNINIMLSAAAFNFKRMINIWKQIFLSFLSRLYQFLSRILISSFMKPEKIKWAF